MTKHEPLRKRLDAVENRAALENPEPAIFLAEDEPFPVRKGKGPSLAIRLGGMRRNPETGELEKINAT